ncbi:MAG TPA: hypothetical protein HA254_05730 [Candidatus Diapherotrites archaeon]|uniref:TrbC/VirB2 family protein n=1 Tax=Candidatus Iainarchaeum sp. TaxID=3101447 RepID=A0A7J4J4J0_9ARCH|nr:hypothetical protein [Candidatus Diapherotrites archaeon]
MGNYSAAAFAVLLMLAPLVAADETADQIMAPINKIYDLMKLVISAVGVIAITGAGAMYMLSGSNIQSRENAKSMASYAVVGLVLVWVAPLVVDYLTAPAAA